METGQTTGNHYVTGISWSPNSKLLIATAIVGNDQKGAYEGLFTVTMTGSYFVYFQVSNRSGASHVNWSLNGQFIVFGCPEIDEIWLCHQCEGASMRARPQSAIRLMLHNDSTRSVIPVAPPPQLLTESISHDMVY